MQCFRVSCLVSSHLGGQTLEQVVQRGCGVYSKHDWTESWAPSSGWPCLSRGIGLDDLKRLLPTSALVWFRDSMLFEQVEFRVYADNTVCFWIQRSAFSFISYQVQILSGLLWTIRFPCFCFQVCFIQHECSRHLH